MNNLHVIEPEFLFTGFRVRYLDKDLRETKIIELALWSQIHIKQLVEFVFFHIWQLL